MLLERSRASGHGCFGSAAIFKHKIRPQSGNDLPLGVNYGASPQKVIQLLEETALQHPKVLRTPGPVGLMIGYGDNGINFELRAWTNEFDNWHLVRSDLSVALYDAVYAAGLSFPFPQRDVHLLKESATLP